MRVSSILIALIAALALGTLATAQQEGRATGRVVQGTPADGPENLSIDIEYPGGNVEDFLYEVRRISGYQNIVIKPGLDKVEMPAVSLGAVPLIDLIDSMSEIVGARFSFRQAGHMIICDDAASIFDSDEEPSGPLITAVWSIERYQPLIPAEDVLSSIEAALAVVGGDPVVRYHEQTGLVIVRGTQDHTLAVTLILNGLENTQSSRERAVKLRQEAAMAEVDLTDAQTKLEVATRELALMSKRLASCKAMHEAGNLDDYAVEEAELDVVKAQAQVSQREAEIKRAQIRVDATAERVATPGK